MPAVRKYRRDTSEVSCCLKYVIFGFNVMFWWLGLGIMGVGVWAWTEKDTFNNLSRLTNIALDPAFILILVGEYRCFPLPCHFPPFLAPFALSRSPHDFRKLVYGELG
ncbi:tetraspanin-5-like isoform X1 [Harpegnathos saltator]|uniref:tetraspanin-5-like isoform X1 n=1 Tax=Harpegnathos saltator TaxID=610380 RepID=UPI000DBEE852|nr:tetraspanin-5-like isoform X1 [Harpegnathos saltator]